MRPYVSKTRWHFQCGRLRPYFGLKRDARVPIPTPFHIRKVSLVQPPTPITHPPPILALLHIRLWALTHHAGKVVLLEYVSYALLLCIVVKGNLTLHLHHSQKIKIFLQIAIDNLKTL
jgi:hypothetical protein